MLPAFFYNRSGFLKLLFRVFCADDLHVFLLQPLQKLRVIDGFGSDDSAQILEIRKEAYSHAVEFALIQQRVDLLSGGHHLPLDG